MTRDDLREWEDVLNRLSELPVYRLHCRDDVSVHFPVTREKGYHFNQEKWTLRERYMYYTHYYDPESDYYGPEFAAPDTFIYVVRQERQSNCFSAERIDVTLYDRHLGSLVLYDYDSEITDPETGEVYEYVLEDPRVEKFLDGLDL